MDFDRFPTIIIGLSPIVIGVTLFCLRKLYPVRQSDSEVAPFPESDFNKWTSYSKALTIFSIVLTATLCASILILLSRLYFTSLLNGQLLRLPETAFALPGLFLGACLSYYLSEFMLKKALGSDYSRFKKASELKTTIDFRAVSFFLPIVIAPICVLLFSYLLFCTSRIERNEIIVRRIGHMPRAYPLSSVVRVIHSDKLKAPNGNIVSRSNYSIFFNDSSDWQIDDEGDGRRFVETIAKLSGKPLESNDIY